jgi:hypothetical protein
MGPGAWLDPRQLPAVVDALRLAATVYRPRPGQPGNRDASIRCALLADHLETAGYGNGTCSGDDGAARSWLTATEAADVLNLTPRRVRQLAATGQLDARRTPAGWLVDPASLARRNAA